MNTFYWLIVVIACIGIEIMTVSLVSIWFAGGAAIAALIAWLGGGFAAQIAAFAVISVFLFFFARRFAMSALRGKTEKTNAEGLIGKTAIVKEEIDNRRMQGRAVVQGQEWTARSISDDEIIAEGAEVIIREIRGVKLIVERIG